MSCERRLSRCSVTRAGSSAVLAVGREAKEMLGRTPETFRPFPLRDGVIADFEITRRCCATHPAREQPPYARQAAHHYLCAFGIPK